MAVASYRTPNDYAPFQTLKPYSLPVNDIIKGLVANNEYWKIGAGQFKSRYNDMLGLDLTLAENIERRDNFMKEAEDKIKNMSGLNFADVNVQNESLKLFDPLLKDEHILHDNFNTKAYSTALDAYRNDPNKNQANLEFATDWYQEWVNAPDKLDNIKKYSQKAKEAQYIPYYDNQKELKQVIKDCPELSQENQYTNPGNMMQYINISSSSRSSSKVQECMDSYLSPQARQQIAIDGYSHYKRNPNSIKTDLINIQTNNILPKINSLELEKKAIEFGGVQKEEEEDYNKIKSTISKLMSEKEMYKEKIDEINNYGDDFIKTNFKQLSSQLHYSNLKNHFGEAFSKLDTKNIVKDSGSGMTAFRTQAEIKIAEYNAQQAANLLKSKQDHDFAIEGYKSQLNIDEEKEKIRLKGIADGTIPDPANPSNPYKIISNVTSDEEATVNFEETENKLNQDYINSVNQLKSLLGVPGEATNADVDAAIAKLENKNFDKLPQAEQDALKIYHSNKQALDIHNEIVNQTLEKLNIKKDDSNYKRAVSEIIKDKLKINGTPVSENDIALLAKGTHPLYEIYDVQVPARGYQGGFSQASSYKDIRNKLTKENIKSDISSSKLGALYNYNGDGKIAPLINSLDKKQKAEFNKKYNKPTYEAALTPAQLKLVEQRMTLFLKDGYKLGEVGTDMQGNVNFKVTSGTGNSQADKTAEVLEQLKLNKDFSGLTTNKQGKIVLKNLIPKTFLYNSNNEAIFTMVNLAMQNQTLKKPFEIRISGNIAAYIVPRFDHNRQTYVYDFSKRQYDGKGGFKEAKVDVLTDPTQFMTFIQSNFNQ